MARVEGQHTNGISEKASPQVVPALYSETGHWTPVAPMAVSMAHRISLAPSEILAQVCETFAPMLDLVTVTVIDQIEGAPRSLSWNRSGASWDEEDRARDAAWTEFALRWNVRDLLPSGWERHSSEHATTQVLGAPLDGILHCETGRLLGPADQELVKDMTMRLFSALCHAHVPR